MILGVLIYLLGVVLSYILVKKYLSKFGRWTKRDRGFALVRSIFSWLTVASCIVLLAEDSQGNEDASW